MRRLHTILLIVSFGLQLIYAGYLTPKLEGMVTGLLPGEKLKVIVRMKEEADISTFERSERVAMVDYLKSFAHDNQRELLSALPEYGNSVGKVMPFWIYNGIAMEATGDVIRDIMQREDVGYIEEDGMVKLFTTPGTCIPHRGNRKVTWNIEIVQAPQAWDLGYNGEGIVIGNIDSGVDAVIPSFGDRWRETNGWFDAVNGRDTPYDDMGHGTHVMGISCGGIMNPGRDDTIGVAPGATLIAAKGLNSEGYGTDAQIDACFQWFASLGPDAPHVINNSWGDDGDRTHYWQATRNLQVLGIHLVFANGNSGVQGPGSVGSPASYPHVIGVGGTLEDDGLLTLTSKGPSPVFDVPETTSLYLDPDWASSRRKPDLNAPGGNVPSCVPGGNGMGGQSGTSQAAPHVAGAIALLLQKNPDLTTKQLWSILTSSVDEPPAGAPYPNMDWGWGRLNVYKALASTPISNNHMNSSINKQHIAVTLSPNPFRQSIAIHFRLSESSDIKVCIYSISGKRIKTLTDDRKKAGSHTIQWNGRDMSGSSVGSGVYYAVLINNTNGAISKVKKEVCLIK
ncbi:S8 family serine peptidase [Fibrobacterota bacterium]